MTATRTAFAARVDAVCARAVQRHAGHPFPALNFDPEHPDPAQLPAVGDYFARYGGLADTTRALHALTPPATSIQAVMGLRWFGAVFVAASRL